MNNVCEGYTSASGGVCARLSCERPKDLVFSELVEICVIMWSGDVLEVPTCT